MDAEPAPASLENAALLKPISKTPITPPTPAWGENASVKIREIAPPRRLMLLRMM